MTKKITLQNKTQDINIRNSSQAKKLRLTVYGGGEVALTVPKQASQRDVDQFLAEKGDWLRSKLERMEQALAKYPEIGKNTKAHYQKHQDSALELATNKVEQHNQDLGFSYNKIRVKNMKTRWGSCTPKRNLHFHYKIKFLPENLQDYLVLHELAHLKHPNHSQKYWNFLESLLPDYQQRKKQLRQFG